MYELNGLDLRSAFLDRRTTTRVCVLAAAVFAASAALLSLGDWRRDAALHHRTGPQRIVALSPAIAELIYALGGWSRVVGICDHTRHPAAAAREKKSVGSFLAPSMETLIALDPDLVVMRRDQPQLAARLQDAGIPTLRVADNSVTAVFRSIDRLGGVLGRHSAARKLRTRLQTRLKQITRSWAARTRPRALLVIGRTDATLRSVYGAAPHSFPGDLLKRAGARNVLAGASARYPVISKEAILAARPEVIIEIVTPPATVSPKKAARTWLRLDTVPAVKKNRVYVVEGDQWLVPGPRAVQAVAALTCLLYPQLQPTLCPRPANGH